VRSTAILIGLAWSALAACRGEHGSPSGSGPGAAATPDPEIVALDELAARVERARGRGTLVNVWATW
jgi:hypothetical protein